MAWITSTRRKSGEVTWWVRDIRDGRQVCIPAGSRPEAEMKKEQYEIRRDLEKEGYDDRYTPEQNALLDRIWGPKQDVLGKAGLN